jgi:hypothetical protein
MHQAQDHRSVPERRCKPQYSHLLVWIGAASILCALGVAPGPALAATEVRGKPANLQLRAENASLREVLDALARAFKLSYRLPPQAGRQVSGLYSGSLHQVLARILDGNDYIVEVSEAGIRVVVLGASGASAILPAALAGPVIPAAAPQLPAGPAAAKGDNPAAAPAAPAKSAPPLTSFR